MKTAHPRSGNEMVILVDENNNEVGAMEKMEAHIKGRLHRAISVFIINTKGEWLLQRRAPGKYHSGNLWSNASCSHPIPGEPAGDAAVRRLAEEMGIRAGLKEIFTFTYSAKFDNGLTENELDHVFLGITDDEPAINIQEVVAWRYISFPELRDEVAKAPATFTVWFRKILERVNDYILHNPSM